MKINISIEESLFLKCYRHLLDSTNNLELLWGSRDSGKSRHIAQQLVYKCLKSQYFFCPLIRKVANTIKDSQWQMIKSVVEDWKLDNYFTFCVSPLEIRCVNGNKFIARGLDDPKRIKSLANPSDAWIEEASDLIDEDWILILTSLRSNYGMVQTFASFNPDTEIDYEETYLYKTFFSSHYPAGILSFKNSLVVEVDGKETIINYRSTHTTYKQNKYCPPDRAFFYENLKNTDEYAYMVYALGLFGHKRSGLEFYKKFDLSKHVKSIAYNPELALHFSWDENVNPYLPVGIFQIDGKTLKLIDEIAGVTPKNTIEDVCQMILEKYSNHRAGCYIYGDATSRKEDVKQQRGQNFFTLIMANLKDLNPILRIPLSNPNVVMRGRWINNVLHHNEGGVTVIINESCKKTINDFLSTKEAPDGTKLKEEWTNPVTKKREQKNGHFTDLFDYIACFAFRNEYDKYQNPPKSSTGTVTKKYIPTNNSY